MSLLGFSQEENFYEWRQSEYFLSAWDTFQNEFIPSYDLAEEIASYTTKDILEYIGNMPENYFTRFDSPDIIDGPFEWCIWTVSLLIRLNSDWPKGAPNLRYKVCDMKIQSIDQAKSNAIYDTDRKYRYDIMLEVVDHEVRFANDIEKDIARLTRALKIPCSTDVSKYPDVGLVEIFWENGFDFVETEAERRCIINGICGNTMSTFVDRVREIFRLKERKQTIVALGMVSEWGTVDYHSFSLLRTQRLSIKANGQRSFRLLTKQIPEVACVGGQFSVND